MERSKLLQSAMDACVSRGAAYDKPENNFARIAAHWNTHLENRKEPALPLDETDVAIMCALIKVARLEHDPAHLDSWTDLAGYAACGAEVSKAGESKPDALTELLYVDREVGKLGALGMGYGGGKRAVTDPDVYQALADKLYGIGAVPPFVKCGALCKGDRVFYSNQSGGKRWGSVTTVSSNSPHVLVLCDDAVPKWFDVNELTAA